MRPILLLSVPYALCLLAACQPLAPASDPDATSGASRPLPAEAAPPPGVSSPAPTASAPPDPSALPTVEHWQCGEILLDARLDGDTMHLAFSGRALALAHAESLTGARYADAKGNAFTRQGDNAKLILASGEDRDCSRSARASPWNEAAARGVGFRAVGNEPGWFVEVGTGESPPLHATLDYGDRRIDVASTRRSGRGFAGQTSDGTEVTLGIERAPCQDGMSGEAFEATAQLQVGDRSYRGCGAFLTD